MIVFETAMMRESDYQDGKKAFEKDVLPADGRPDNKDWMNGWLDASNKEKDYQDSSIEVELRLLHGRLEITAGGRKLDTEGLSVEQSGGNIYAHATFRISEIQ